MNSVFSEVTAVKREWTRKTELFCGSLFVRQWSKELISSDNRHFSFAMASRHRNPFLFAERVFSS